MEEFQDLLVDSTHPRSACRDTTMFASMNAIDDRELKHVKDP